MNCSSTLEAFGFACEITDIIVSMPTSWSSNKARQDKGLQAVHQVRLTNRTSRLILHRRYKACQDMLASGLDAFPNGLGEQLRQLLSSSRKQGVDRVQVAVATRSPTQPLSEDDINDSRQATTALRTRLQALMQSTTFLQESQWLCWCAPIPANCIP